MKRWIMKLFGRTKRCRMCGKVKYVKHFSPSRQVKDGFYSYCKPCSAMYGRLWRMRRAEANLTNPFGANFVVVEKASVS